MFTILFAILNGVSVYLTIPLLDTLFQDPASNQNISQTSSITSSSSFLPDWIISIKDDIVNTFNTYILTGDKIEILIKICSVILVAFLLK